MILAFRHGNHRSLFGCSACFWGSRSSIDICKSASKAFIVGSKSSSPVRVWRGEFKSAAPGGHRYLVRQRRAGMFQTSVTLPDAADSVQIEATFEHGLLRLEVPKSEASKPKRIALKTGT